MKKWKLEGKKVTSLKTKIITSKYKAKENNKMVKVKSQIDENKKKKEFTIVFYFPNNSHYFSIKFLVGLI